MALTPPGAPQYDLPKDLLGAPLFLLVPSEEDDEAEAEGEGPAEGGEGLEATLFEAAGEELLQQWVHLISDAIVDSAFVRSYKPSGTAAPPLSRPCTENEATGLKSASLVAHRLFAAHAGAHVGVLASPQGSAPKRRNLLSS